MQKIKSYIIKNYKILLIFILVVGTIALVFINPFKKRQDSQISPFSKMGTDNKSGEKYFEVTKTLPEETQIEAWETYTPIIVFFSEPVNEDNIKVEVSPSTPVVIIKIGEEDKHVRIVPQDGWEHNVDYVITIKEALSTNGSVLETPYVRTLRITRPEERPKIRIN